MNASQRTDDVARTICSAEAWREERRLNSRDPGENWDRIVKQWTPWSFAAATAVALTLTTQGAFAGPDWVEDGDAGSNLETAQPINLGKGSQLQRIFGRLQGNVSPLTGGIETDFQDMYQVLVTDPVNLLFSSVDTSTTFQTSLWLFDSDGNALLGNIFAPGSFEGAAGLTGSEIQNFSTDDTGIVITKPGIYYIAICAIVDEPLSGGESMFFFSMSDEVSGPDGEGGNGMLGGWSGGEGIFGDYEIRVDGVGFIPAPGAMSLLAIGFLGINRRRRD